MSNSNNIHCINPYPFIIHADPLLEDTAYPTHTHGLTLVGMPEFFMDPLAFGGEGNTGRINAAYKYFTDPKNADKLNAILDGKTIKLTGKELNPRGICNEPYTYCFREVSPDFEAVKLAYGRGIAEVIPTIRFIQIYVEGDYYALTDKYYRGGVTY
jgi:hypothetical protein